MFLAHLCFISINLGVGSNISSIQPTAAMRANVGIKYGDEIISLNGMAGACSVRSGPIYFELGEQQQSIIVVLDIVDDI